MGSSNRGRGVRYAIGKLAGGNARRGTGQKHLVEAKSLVAVAFFIHEELRAGIESPPPTEHGLWSQQISDTETRLNHPGIELLEDAVATSRPIPLVFGSTRQTPRGRIPDIGGELPFPQMLFPLPLL